MSEAIAVLAAVFLTAGFALIRDWLTVRRDDRIRREQTAAERVRFERDIIGELLVGLHLVVPSVVNRMWALDRVRRGQGEINPERWQKYLADAETFRAILSRARVSVLNPQARVHISALREQFGTMSLKLDLLADGADVPDLQERFEEFQVITTDANRGLEEAALRWDGAVAVSTG